ncbi:MAG TPA: response regulator [Ginsengibacter sp.]|nr:response regulator [Ginsengibacter sp.]
MRTRILIVDKSTLLTRRLGELVTESAEIEDIEISISYLDASKKIKSNPPDIVLLDLALAGNNSMELLREIKKDNQKIFVIVVSDTPDERIKKQCEQAGADYFFDKYKEFEKIPDAIRQIASIA